MKMLISSFVIVVLAVQGLALRHTERVLQESTDDRVVKLEQRVERLEQLMFNAVSLSVFDAERQLANTQVRLQNSERLYAQGFIDNVRMSQDRFDCERAQRELQLAQAQSGGRRIATEIEVLQANRNLEVAIQRLQYSEKLSSRGFVSKAEIEKDRHQVNLMTKELQLAEDRLKAIAEILDTQDKASPVKDGQQKDQQKQDEQPNQKQEDNDQR